MYIKIQKRFEEQVEKPAIEAKKKKLKLIRLSRVTPINHSEIKKHNKRYQEKVKILTEQKAK